MFKNILLAGIVSFFSSGMVSCGKDKPGTADQQTSPAKKDGQRYALDTLNSRIEWKAYKVFKSENTSHFGTIKFESGDVTVKAGKLTSGKFVANMASLANVDLKDDAEQKAKLESHLKSTDFFHTEKFPTASYEITNVAAAPAAGDYNMVLDGNLTIKGVSRPTRFYANISVTSGTVNIATEPTDIRREDFGVKFQVPLANGIIKNEISLQILVKAVAKK